MAWQRIVLGEWSAFLRSFAFQHDGWLVRVQISGGGVLQHSAYLPLRGLSLDGDGVAVAVGEGDARQEWTVRKARDLKVDELPDGSHRALIIEGEDSSLTLTFRLPMPTEAVDDVMI